ncbi:SPOR domain-containing protein [Arenibaculum pallidiluteum]|uniref:SPOR domain-containing protein n=1 Tax=Arenibaculum pallidiluteum TaxID=2812559 RepID=UPI001A96CF31|nr:SPOR domain-containing protein [Arenibaculum pallidiluteum]
MKPAVAALGGTLALGAVGGGAFYAGRVTGEAPPAPPPAAAEAPAPAAASAKAEAPAPAPPRKVEEIVRPAEWPVFSIELAAFRDLDRAREYAEVMAQRNLAVELVETVDAGGRSWFRVRFGRFDDPRQAAARLPEVERIAGIFGVVTTEFPQPTAAR